MTFDEALPFVKHICRKWVGHYPLLNFDDFVNEIWLRCDFKKFCYGDKRVGKYIQYRIIDYIRETLGRTGNRKRDDSGTVRLAGSEFPGRKDPGFEAVDSDDEFEFLISSLKGRDRFIIDQYYRHGKTQAEIAGRLGLTECCISMRRKAALERLRVRVA